MGDLLSVLPNKVGFRRTGLLCLLPSCGVEWVSLRAIVSVRSVEPSGVANVQVFPSTVRQYFSFTHFALFFGCFRVIFCQSILTRWWSHVANCFADTTVR